MRCLAGDGQFQNHIVFGIWQQGPPEKIDFLEVRNGDEREAEFLDSLCRQGDHPRPAQNIEVFAEQGNGQIGDETPPGSGGNDLIGRPFSGTQTGDKNIGVNDRLYHGVKFDTMMVACQCRAGAGKSRIAGWSRFDRVAEALVGKQPRPRRPGGAERLLAIPEMAPSRGIEPLFGP